MEHLTDNQRLYLHLWLNYFQYHQNEYFDIGGSKPYAGDRMFKWINEVLQLGGYHDHDKYWLNGLKRLSNYQDIVKDYFQVLYKKS